jgi:hypothetical protein
MLELEGLATLIFDVVSRLYFMSVPGGRAEADTATLERFPGPCLYD